MSVLTYLLDIGSTGESKLVGVGEEGDAAGFVEAHATPGHWGRKGAVHFGDDVLRGDHALDDATRAGGGRRRCSKRRRAR